MAKPKTEQEFMEEVAAELRGDSEAADEVYESAPEAQESDEAAPAGDAAAGADELEALRAERDDLKDRFVRALADAENTRKRAERDRREAETYGGSKLARDMLPVYDNLSRALETATEEQKEISKALLEGVELTMRELLNVFKKHGIEPISPEVGDKFDPQMHQAMFEAPVPDTKAGDIIQVMATGFLLHDRLLRPAQVGVSSTPAS
ncbi:co-chaperone GrpE [Oceanicola granulosus HTCC2516]|uniref:Protein GrpE n=1 Tax=Oceanicola granulosus (strain ATCC BAA-861 / DSM 15982 / KCTC 12143 / HTCC2516) TaxID=314256 RepID=Q2CJT3_OCEGH|nr:nucleotide exchange factor GrpE [Oceanicola granulosus]EAR53056.1 co-chaperone GrpE [Oceanicola granulosus HTCC2516]